MFARRLSAFTPMLQQIIDGYMQKNFAPMYEDAARDRQAREYVGTRSEVLKGLKAVKGFENVEKLFEASGDPFEHNGGKFQNTPYNQILRDNPELLKIEVTKHPVTGQFLDKPTAARMTQIERIKSVHRRWSQSRNTLPASQVAKVVKAGAQVQQRNAQHAHRQTINAGGGASGSGGRTPSSGNQFVSELKNRSAGVLTADDLI
jgi:hypothetical protein